MADIGLKISTQGQNVNTALPESLVVFSKYPSLKVDKDKNPKHRGALRAQINYNSPLAQGLNLLYQFKHNYNYIPATMGVYSFSSFDTFTGITSLVAGTMPLDFGNGNDGISILADTENVYFYITIGTPGGYPSGFGNQLIVTISYYVFAENGA